MKKTIAILLIAAVAIVSCKSGNESVLNGKWTTITVNKGQMSLETPFEMTTKDISKELTSVNQYLKSMELKMSPESNSNFLVMINGIEYIDEIKPDYKGAAESGIKSLENEGKMKDVKYTSADITLAGKPGVQQTGTFTFQSKQYDFKHNVYGYDNKIAQVLVAAPQKDEAGAKIMEKILGSLALK